MIDAEAEKLIDKERKRIAAAVTKIAGQIYLLRDNAALLATEMYSLRICLSKLQSLHDSLATRQSVVRTSRRMS